MSDKKIIPINDAASNKAKNLKIGSIIDDISRDYPIELRSKSMISKDKVIASVERMGLENHIVRSYSSSELDTMTSEEIERAAVMLEALAQDIRKAKKSK